VEWGIELMVMIAGLDGVMKLMVMGLGETRYGNGLGMLSKKHSFFWF
jgi:hypothetical protein